MDLRRYRRLQCMKFSIKFLINHVSEFIHTNQPHSSLSLFAHFSKVHEIAAPRMYLTIAWGGCTRRHCWHSLCWYRLYSVQRWRGPQLGYGLSCCRWRCGRDSWATMPRLNFTRLFTSDVHIYERSTLNVLIMQDFVRFQFDILPHFWLRKMPAQRAGCPLAAAAYCRFWNDFLIGIFRPISDWSYIQNSVTLMRPMKGHS